MLSPVLPCTHSSNLPHHLRRLGLVQGEKKKSKQEKKPEKVKELPESHSQDMALNPGELDLGINYLTSEGPGSDRPGSRRSWSDLS